MDGCDLSDLTRQREVRGNLWWWPQLKLENARPRSGFARSRLELGQWEKGYLSVVETGDRRGRIKAGGICAIGRFWAQFLHLDSRYVRTRCRDTGIGEIL
jgi:hypothetical protein